MYKLYCQIIYLFQDLHISKLGDESVSHFSQSLLDKLQFKNIFNIVKICHHFSQRLQSRSQAPPVLVSSSDSIL